MIFELNARYKQETFPFFCELTNDETWRRAATYESFSYKYMRNFSDFFVPAT
jgi:hypothetical protein